MKMYEIVDQYDFTLFWSLDKNKANSYYKEFKPVWRETGRVIKIKVHE